MGNRTKGWMVAKSLALIAAVVFASQEEVVSADAACQLCANYTYNGNPAGQICRPWVVGFDGCADIQVAPPPTPFYLCQDTGIPCP